MADTTINHNINNANNQTINSYNKETSTYDKEIVQAITDGVNNMQQQTRTTSDQNDILTSEIIADENEAVQEELIIYGIS